MMKLTIVSLIAAVVSMSSLVAEEPFIILKRGTGEKIKPANGQMAANSSGAIQFTDVLGKKHTYSRGQIKYIYNDCPNSIKIIEKMFRYQRFADVVKAVDSLGAADIYLGWGGFAYYLKAMAQVQLNQVGDAETTLKKGTVIAMAENRDDLLKDGMKVTQALKSPGNVPNKPTPLFLLLQGLVYEKQKKYKEAALEYMKAVMLFPRDNRQGTDLERLWAMARLVDVLKEGKDMGASGLFLEQMKSEM